MLTIVVRYTCLCEEFLSAAQACIDERILGILKEYYAHYIDSNRKLSQIKDLRALLKVLEKRDILNFCNVEPLSYISTTFLNDSVVLNKIRNYNKFRLQNTQYSPLHNMYEDTSGSSAEHENNSKTDNKSCAPQPKGQSFKLEGQQVSHRHVTSPTTYSTQEAMLQQMVLSRISERIGRSWRDTVRFLDIPEYQIDAIQNKYPFDLKEQSYEALKLCICKYSTDSWKLNLLRALEKARRRDLKELVEELIIRTRIE